MSQTASAIVRSPAEIVQNSPVSQAPNGICYARSGEITIADNDLERMTAAVPVSIAAALSRKAYYFVPPTVMTLRSATTRFAIATSISAMPSASLSRLA
jgi:hypothetical protein